MRRNDREIADFNTILSIIDECKILRLGLIDNGFAYIVPVNFAYTAIDGEICFYIHGAKAGKKDDILQSNNIYTFEMDTPLKIECNAENKYATMRYKSVMGKCEASFLDGEQKEHAMDTIFMRRYEETKNFDYNKSSLSHTAMIKLKVIEISAKSDVV